MNTCCSNTLYSFGRGGVAATLLSDLVIRPRSLTQRLKTHLQSSRKRGSYEMVRGSAPEAVDVLRKPPARNPSCQSNKATSHRPIEIFRGHRISYRSFLSISTYYPKTPKDSGVAGPTWNCQNIRGLPKPLNNMIWSFDSIGHDPT